MVINKTVLGQAPFSVSISVVGMTLILLFTVMEPEASAGLDFWQRLLFWSGQIFTSLLGIILASFLIRRLATFALSDIWLVLLTGGVASLVVSPLFLVIENLFPALERLPDSALDEFAETGLLPDLLVQSVETMPSLTLAWVLVNLPILLNSTFIKTNNNDPNDHNPPPPVKDQKQHDERKQFLEKLPTSIGRDIMYVSSDLHYLNVTTGLGNTLVLGSIAKFAEMFDDDGFLVHRSHWVNKAFVARIVISGNNALCVMQDGNTVPISRSKRKLVKAYFGHNNPTNANTVVELNSNQKIR